MSSLKVLPASPHFGDAEDSPILETLPAFPSIAWRGAFESYRRAMDGTTEASDVAHFATFWATAASALGRRVAMNAGDVVYANVYLTVYGPTGDKKTTAMRRVLNCGLIPQGVKLLSNTGSVEGLADALQDEDAEDKPCLFFWEELSSLLAKGRWSGSHIFEFLTEVFDCPPEFGLRYRQRPVRIKNPTPTILAGTTLEWFWRNARPDDFYGGFGNRFLFLTGPRKPPIPNPADPDEARLDEVRDALRSLEDCPAERVRFSSPAERLFAEVYHELDQKTRSGLLGAATKRLHVYARKLALVYSALEGTVPTIELDQLKAAAAVILYAAECARMLIEAQASTGRPEGELEQLLLKWVKTHEGDKKRVMQQQTWRYCGSAERFNRSFQALVVAGAIEPPDKDGRVWLAR